MGSRMSQRPLVADIDALVRSLDAGRFRSLSVGIGLGDLRPVKKSPPEPVTETRFSRMSQTILEASRNPVAIASAEATRSSRAIASPRRGLGRVLARLVACSFDIVIVISSSLLALLVAGFMFGGRTPSGASFGVLKSLPFRWIAGFGALELCAGLGAIYFIYWILFKFVAGTTLGESLVGTSRRENATGVDSEEGAR
jgi:hypothetical protein